MNTKYELIETVKLTPAGKKLRRLRALMDFGDVLSGDLGGLIERPDNLSGRDGAWVYGDAQVCGNARVCGDAKVCGHAKVYGDAQVSGNADKAHHIRRAVTGGR